MTATVCQMGVRIHAMKGSAAAQRTSVAQPSYVIQIDTLLTSVVRM